jgi:hypothetical protein
MAHFKTEIPTEAKTFIDSLKGRRTFSSITLTEENNILIMWEDDTLYTGLTVPVDYPLNMLQAGKLPQKTFKASEREKATPSLPSKKDAPTAKPEPKTVIPIYLNEEQVKESAVKGQSMEFYGILPRWVTFNPRVDRYTEGYFYRHKNQKPLEQSKAVA